MSGTITRRTFVEGLFVGAVPALAACTRKKREEEEAPEPVKERPAQLVRFGQAHFGPTLDMQITTSSRAAAIADCVVEPLLRFDAANALTPCLLAEMPVVEEDGVTYRCTLRSGVSFHDGTTLSAHDVKYSFERMFRPETAAQSTYLYDMIRGAKAMLTGAAISLEGIVVEDEEHLTFVLEEPLATFVDNLGLSYAGILPQNACEAAGALWGEGTNLVGTGPYRLTQNDDSTTVLERFDGYHDGSPSLERLEVLYWDDAGDKLRAFEAKDIDFCELDSSVVAHYEEDPDLSGLITRYVPLGVQFVNLNLRSSKLSNVRVREALSLAIDRRALVEETLPGIGDPAHGFINPAIPGYDADSDVLPYDPERARALLAEAGASNLELTGRIRSRDAAVMQAVADAWEAVGVRLSVEQVESAQWAQDQAAGDLEVTTLAWYPLYADADSQMYTYFARDNAARKSSFYDNWEFNDLVDRARNSRDEDERAELYRRADERLSRLDYATIPLFYPAARYIAWDYVRNAGVGNLVYDLRDLDVDERDDSTADGTEA